LEDLTDVFEEEEEKEKKSLFSSLHNNEHKHNAQNNQSCGRLPEMQTHIKEGNLYLIHKLPNTKYNN